MGERTLCAACFYSSSLFFKIKGLLGRKSLPQSEGLWLKPCNSIHMFFMKFPIDAIFLDKENRVIRIFHGIRPWRATPLVWKSHSVLELASGVASEFGLKAGDLLVFE
ncbi:MAG: DUF192 domain-containing protein [Blastochloris sp.]|nr:DUF192 domain-containing protein [Blastochloris sp.]